MKFKYLLLILVISITAAAHAADWIYVVVRASDNKQGDIDYEEVIEDFKGRLFFEIAETKV